jgi:hypothetical protein
MISNSALTRTVAGAVMSGAIALAGTVFGPATAHAIEFHPAPQVGEVPRVGSSLGQSPHVRVGFDPQPDPPKVAAGTPGDQ